MANNKARVQMVAEVRGWNCEYCNRKTRQYLGNASEDKRADEATVDHLIPTSKGGTDELDNLVIACRSCNIRKKNLVRSEFGLKYFANRLIDGALDRLSQ